jgi:hypothetical protein
MNSIPVHFRHLSLFAPSSLFSVRIEPETLNMKSKGEFTAFTTVPEGYDLKDWNIGNLTCEGASAVKGVLADNAYVAKFNRQNLNGVPVGEAVPLTVKGAFAVNGMPALIQGMVG